MNFTLPAHLRKKDEDTVAHLFEKAVEDETASLMQQLKTAASNLCKSMSEIGIKVHTKSTEFLVETFDDSYGYIEGDDAAMKVEIMQAYVTGNKERFFALHDRLYKQSIAREAERNVWENRAPDDGF